MFDAAVVSVTVAPPNPSAVGVPGTFNEQRSGNAGTATAAAAFAADVIVSAKLMLIPESLLILLKVWLLAWAGCQKEQRHPSSPS